MDLSLLGAPGGLDERMNGMAPQSIVAYQIPPNGIIPAHSAALVVIPNGVGGFTRYGWFTAACGRILQQDSTHILNMFKQNGVAFDLQQNMLRCLGEACGAGNPELYQERCRVGAMILGCYQAISAEEQIFWLRHDAELRKAFIAVHYKSTMQSCHMLATSSGPLTNQQRQAYLDDCHAYEKLLLVNQSQLEHVQKVQKGLLALLPKDKAAEISGLCGLTAPPQPAKSTAVSNKPPMEATPTPIAGRQPLAPISGNVASQQPKVEPDTGLKRKREERAPKTVSPVIDLGDESEDEDALQNQVDALQAKIAAIRERTAHEDQIVPNKKPRTQKKPSTGTSAPASSGAAMPSSRPTPTIQDPFLPPRSSQNAPKTSVPIAPPAAQMAPTARVDSLLRVTIKAKGLPDFKVNLGSAASLATLMECARKEFNLPSEQVAYLVHKEKHLKLESLVRDTDLQDMATVYFICPGPMPVPPSSDPQVTNSPQPSIRFAVRKPGQPELWVQTYIGTTLAKIIKTAKARFKIPDDHFAYLQLRGKPFKAEQEVQDAKIKNNDIVDLVAYKSTATTLQPTPKLTDKKTQRTEIDLTSPPPQPAQPAPVPAARDQPPLCKEQQEVVDLILGGHNVFYTGSAGCGKSTVLKTFVPLLREQGKNVRIVAPTGKAALDINGSTTWTYAGWTPASMKRPLKDLIKNAHGKFVHKRFKETHCLVIDEISMVENHILSRLNIIMKESRGNDRPFGGVQLVVTGDFCQLPPVKPFEFCMLCGRESPQRLTPEKKIVHRCPQHGDSKDEDKWAFRSQAWEECKFKHINLATIHRQSDEVFIKVLQKLRIGTPLTQADRDLLLNHPCDVTNAVKLFPTREQVRRINQEEFDKLPSAKQTYMCLDMFQWNQARHPHLERQGERQYDDSLIALRQHKLDVSVDYKLGMLVVLLVNLDITAGLVNGSQGKIVGFEPHDPAKLPKASVREGGPSSGGRDRSGRFTSQVGRFPSTQSKRRGRESSMEPEGREVKGELRGEHAALREAQIKAFIEQCRNKSKMWPIVEFHNGHKRTIYADCQINELGDEREYTLIGRTQIPLIAAWAMTVHKSQGMTLNRVIVDLGRSFEEGQEYVALSRARSLEGLKVLSLGDGVGKGGGGGGNEQVREFLWEKFGLR